MRRKKLEKRNYFTNASYAMPLGLCCQAEGREGATGNYGIVIAVVRPFLLLIVIYEMLKLFLIKYAVAGIVLESAFGSVFRLSLSIANIQSSKRRQCYVCVVKGLNGGNTAYGPNA